MLRYLLLSTVIVFAVAIVVAGWVNRDLIRIKIASVYARVAPKPRGRQRARAGEGIGAGRGCPVGPLGASGVPDADVGVARTRSVRAGASAQGGGSDCAAGELGVW